MKNKIYKIIAHYQTRGIQLYRINIRLLFDIVSRAIINPIKKS
jgi:hypothetical protein